MKFRRMLGLAAAMAGALTIAQAAFAQRAAPAPSAPPTAEKAALVDLTGYWVAVVTEDWRWRMLTAPKGDYASVPLNAAGRKIADEFDPALYGGATATGAIGGGGSIAGRVERTPIGRYQVSGIIDCRAYGAAGIMRMPTRVHISWADPNELRLETDWGGQTRLFHFVPGRPYADLPRPAMAPGQEVPANQAAASMQGYSVAVWERPYGGNAPAYQRGPLPRRPGALAGEGPAMTEPGGDLAVVTTDLAPGWLRRNGVPYGSHTRLTEHYQEVTDPAGRRWFDVTTEVIDPEYLTAPFITSSDFEQEPDGSKWAPHPCKQVTEP
jgi:hypothetical protein